uniref:Uncharacterized protein n=1 Tax=Oryza glumipatula TaxID=40148 RepID=A0A0E0A0H1_9ORYZ
METTQRDGRGEKEEGRMRTTPVGIGGRGATEGSANHRAQRTSMFPRGHAWAPTSSRPRHARRDDWANKSPAPSSSPSMPTCSPLSLPSYASLPPPTPLFLSDPQILKDSHGRTATIASPPSPARSCCFPSTAMTPMASTEGIER